ncbi:MAG: response regulator [Rikenellaceae bacterium]|nr:response regulator [Rikenellaceae bacterium]
MYLARLFLSIAAIWLPFAGKAAGSGPDFHHLGPEAGLSQVTINGLYQDENGLLWIGTKEGVKYYDGSRVGSLTVPGLNTWITSGLVPTICGDGRGHLYINTDFEIVEYDLVDNTARTVFSQTNTSKPPGISFHYGEDALWIGLGDGIYLYRDGRVTHFHTLEDGGEISSVYGTRERVYAGTRDRGLISVDRRGTERQVTGPLSEIISIYPDDRGNIWCGTYSDGACRIGPSGEVTFFRRDGSTESLSSDYVRAICQDRAGNMWIGTFSGLDIIDRTDGSVTAYGLSDHDRKGLSNLSIWAILRDRQGTMWLGTYYGGLDYCNPDTDRFVHYDLGFNAGNGYSVVSTIAADRRGDLWLGTEGNGLVRMDGRTREYTFVEGYLFSRYNIKSLLYEPATDHLWIGTHQGGLFRYDAAGGACTHYAINPHDATSRSETVHDIVPCNGGLLIGTLLGVYYMDAEGTVAPVEPFSSSIFEANRILVSRSGCVWVAGNDLCMFDPSTDEIHRYGDRLEEFTAGGKLSTTTLFEDSSGRICIGTAGYGMLVYDPEDDSFARYHKGNCDLSGDYVGAISQTADGNYLIGTNTGLSYLDQENMRSYVFSAANGFPLHSMMPGCILARSDTDEIFLGGLNGMAVVPQASLMAGDQPFDLYLSGLYVNNRRVTPGDSTGILRRRLMYTDGITLRYRENNLAIEVGSDNLAGLGQPLHQYMLSGYDREWITYSPEVPVQYMNLPYGRYEFRARAVLFGSGEEREIRLGIVVRPPVYAAWYAYLFYIVMGVGLIGWGVYFYRSRLLLRTSLEFERREKEQSELVNQGKLRFFGNISHELRTPLTLIMAQLELLLDTGKLSREHHSRLSGIYDGSRRMAGLVNELLDFMKFEQGKFRLRVSKCDIVGFVREVYTSFSALAVRKGIKFTLRTEAESLNVWFDKVQMLKVLNNLLGNAFKYTGAGGEITVTIGPVEDDYVCISVADDGIGIPGQLREKVFERFYQVDNDINHDISHTGTGIGLSLTRYIVEAHHGTIRVGESGGKGTVFIVRLSCDEHLFDNDPTADISTGGIEPVPVSDITGKYPGEEEVSSLHENTVHSYSILIVEDDPVLLRTLVSIFDPLCNVYEAADGRQALEKVAKHAPDLVLSDMMMPVMAGDELCRRLKNNFETSHIPVVLLTALDGVDNSIRGFNCGADDYITKPFNVKVLVARCFAILNNRRRMQEKFSRQEEPSAQMITSNDLDREFIDRLICIIEENVTTGNLNVSLLCTRLGMSRTKLFNKIKGITGQSPNEFIQSVKLKTAARMLRERADLNISDIAYLLGFSSLNYFGKYFRNAFGISPTAYRNGRRPEGEPKEGSDVERTDSHGESGN